MTEVRCVANIVTTLGLIVVSIVAVSIGYTLISQYVSQTFRPSPEISVTYAKLIYITDSENVAGTTYVTFKGEIGVGNPGPAVDGHVCIVSMISVIAGTTTSLSTSELSQHCSQSFTMRSGYATYSFIVRVPRSVMDSLGCRGAYSSCPLNRDWHFVVYARNIRIGSMERAALIKPIYIIPS